MELSVLRPVYEREGPFVTVYLEGRSPAEDADKQVRLRWKALRERLEAADADTRAVDAVEKDLLEGTAGEEQTNGRVIVADAAGVVLDAPWDAALGAGDDAHTGVLPELGPYVREKARAVRALVVVADQEGAVVRKEVIARQHAPRVEAVEDVAGSAFEGVHKPRGQAHAHNRIQRRADEAVQRNAKDIAQHLRKTAEAFRPEVLVLAGGVQARTAVREALPSELGKLLTETERGGQSGHGLHEEDDALAEELLRIAGEVHDAAAERRTGGLREGLAHGEAAEGDIPVGAAAESGAVGTLMFEPGVPASREAFLLKVCAGTGSSFALTAEGADLKDGVGALLRFPPEGG